jgi:hypothetical protein
MMNPTEARACCVCKHWRPISGSVFKKGECLKSPWNVEYENPETGTRQLVEYWTTGCYATCEKWEAV